MTLLRLGTRKSALAQAQANWVAERLRAAFPELKVELILITTSGDQMPIERVKDADGGLKALFTKEIEEALLDNKIDFAVHSLKDMAAQLPKGLVIGAVPIREDARDVWISKTKIPFSQIPKGTRIGTGAVRRKAQLKRLNPDVVVVDIRGNVDTRLQKLQKENLDGIILALAGLRRLGREAAATEILSADVLVPAVGQGCLAIEIREGNTLMNSFLGALDHPLSHAAAEAERAFLKTLGGSCQTPIAAHAEAFGQTLTMVGLVTSLDGTEEVRDEIKGAIDEAASLGQSLAKKLLAFGADKLLHS